MVIQYKCVIQFHIQIKEIRSMHHFIFSDILSYIFLGQLCRCEMRHMHPACVHTGQGAVEILERSRCQCEITVIVRSTGHPLHRRYLRILTPCLQLGIFAALHRQAHLSSRITSMCNLSVQIHAIHTCPVTVATLLHLVTVLVMAHILQNKHVIQSGIEPFQ